MCICIIQVEVVAQQLRRCIRYLRVLGRRKRVRHCHRRVVGAVDGDLDRVGGRRAGRVGGRQRVGQGDGLAGFEEVQVRAVGRVAIWRRARRRRVDHTGAESGFKQGLQPCVKRAAAPYRACGQRLADINHVAGVDIIEAHRAVDTQDLRACDQGLGKGDVGHIADCRRVVGAGDGDGNLPGVRRTVVVGAPHRVGEHQRLADRQIVKCLCCGVEDPGQVVRVSGIGSQPRGRRHAEHGKQCRVGECHVGGTRCDHTCRRRVHRVRQVGIGHRQGAAGAQPRIGLGQRLRNAVRCHHRDVRAVVGALDGDCHGLVAVRAEVVGHPHRVGLGDAGTFFQGLGIAIQIVQGVGPLAATGVDRQAAVSGRGCALDAPGLGRAGVDVARAQLPAHRRRASNHGAVIQVAGLGHGARQRRGYIGDHRAVIGALDGDGHRLVDVGAEVVGHPHRVGLVHTCAFGQGLGVGVAVVQCIGPLAGAGVDRQAAVGGRGATLDAPGLGGASVDVARAQLPADRCHAGDCSTVVEVAGFSHRAGQGTGRVSDDRAVVGALEGDSHRLVDVRTEVVGHSHRVGLVDAGAFFQGLGVAIQIVQGVGPLAATGIDRQAAVGGRRTALDAPGLGGAGVDVGRAQLPADRRRAGHCGAVVQVAGLDDCARQRRGGVGDHRAVVGALDGDGHGLVDVGAEVVGHPHRVGLVDAGAFFQRLGGRQAVVQGVGPLAGRVDRQVAVGGRRTALDAPGLGRAGVDVGGAQLAAHRRRAGDCGAVVQVAGFGHGARQRRGGVGDHRAVVGAADGDDHVLGDRRSMPVTNAYDICLGNGLPLCQILGRRVVEVIGPLNRTVGRICSFVHRAKHQSAERRGVARGGRNGRTVAVGKVDVVETHDTRNAECVGGAGRGVGIFGHRARLRTAGDRDNVIGTGKRDGRRGPG